MDILIGLVGTGPLNRLAAEHLFDEHHFEVASIEASRREMIEALVVHLGLDWAYVLEPELAHQPIPGLGVSYRHLERTLAHEWGRMSVAPDLWVRCLELALGLPDAPIHDRIVVSDVTQPNEAAMLKTRGGLLVRVITPGDVEVAGSADLLDAQTMIVADDESLHRMLDALVDQLVAGEVAAA